jgi:hypothetical protein
VFANVLGGASALDKKAKDNFEKKIEMLNNEIKKLKYNLNDANEAVSFLVGRTNDIVEICEDIGSKVISLVGFLKTCGVIDMESYEQHVAENNIRLFFSNPEEVVSRFVSGLSNDPKFIEISDKWQRKARRREARRKKYKAGS